MYMLKIITEGYVTFTAVLWSGGTELSRGGAELNRGEGEPRDESSHQLVASHPSIRQMGIYLLTESGEKS
jgi:hypothetical protein